MCKQEPVYTEELNGYTINIFPDTDPSDPREWDNLGTMVCKHPRYNLGDVQVGDRKFVKDKPFFPDTDSVLEFVNKKDVIALPLYLLDHSGLWMRTGRFAEDSGGWDTSHVGYIYVTKEQIRKEYGKAGRKGIETATRVLEGEVKAYSDYLSGNAYGYVVEKDGIEDSCWGYIGDYDDEGGCLDEARSFAK